MDQELLKTELKAFVAGKTKLVAAAEITGDLKLFSSGVLDSIAFVQLIAFIHAKFKLKLTPAMGANMKALDSIDQIAAFAARHAPPGAA